MGWDWMVVARDGSVKENLTLLGFGGVLEGVDWGLIKVLSKCYQSAVGVGLKW